MIAVVTDEVRCALLAADLITRMGWLALLNKWEIADTLPVELTVPSFAQEYNSSTYADVMRILHNSLSPAQVSLAWWLFGLNKTPDEWGDWWVNRHSAVEPPRAIERSVLDEAFDTIASVKPFLPITMPKLR